MNDLTEGLVAAFKLVITLDSDLIEISLRSLQVTVSAVVIAAIVGLPFGAWLSVTRFRFRRIFPLVLLIFQFNRENLFHIGNSAHKGTAE